MRVSVIGGSTVDEDAEQLAFEVGREIAARGHELVCGGRGGAMRAACRGANEAGGLTIGILPDLDRATANEFVDVPIVTGVGNARNAMVVANGDAAVAIDGSYGTLSEIALMLDAGRPVAGLLTHDVEGVEHVESATAALHYVEDAVASD